MRLLQLNLKLFEPETRSWHGNLYKASLHKNSYDWIHFNIISIILLEQLINLSPIFFYFVRWHQLEPKLFEPETRSWLGNLRKASLHNYAHDLMYFNIIYNIFLEQLINLSTSDYYFCAMAST